MFTSWGRETALPFSKAELEHILNELDDSGKYGMVLRAKGIVPASDAEGVWYHFDYTPGEGEIRTGAADYTGRLCVIGSKIDEAAIGKLFDTRA
ncbi:MAG: cobalamin biosynthesis protein CobW [Clostridia bacterium]|nr:cobalamin biosynthesis protein CobW [Clostridia bacterium]